MKNIGKLLICAFALSSFNAQGMILPPNDLFLEDDPDKPSNITEQEFYQIIDRVAVVYGPVIALHNAKLIVSKDWASATVNAFARQQGHEWHVAMFGGLARRSEMNEDGFALVVCHELGHHLGGFAFYGDYWAASEGQSDYFATHACARRVWAHDWAENAKHREKADPTVKAKCDSQWKTREDQNLCYRIAHAGLPLGTLLAALGRQPPPKFDTPDRREVETTMTRHPPAQCRLDTYFNGALCTRGFETSIIPGKGNSAGQTGIEAEREAAMHTCTTYAGYSEGNRPRCWFKPNLARDDESRVP